jgi:hypothetical protein
LAAGGLQTRLSDSFTTCSGNRWHLLSCVFGKQLDQPSCWPCVSSLIYSQDPVDHHFLSRLTWPELYALQVNYSGHPMTSSVCLEVLASTYTYSTDDTIQNCNNSVPYSPTYKDYRKRFLGMSIMLLSVYSMFSLKFKNIFMLEYKGFIPI